MEIFFEILKYTIPAIIVFFATYFIARGFFENERKRDNLRLVLKNKEIITPLRLQAYERAIMFLERISPESLIMRIHKPGMSNKQLHQEMLQAIRVEYEHNLSQQLYMSHEAWEVIKGAKGNVIKLINTCAESIDKRGAAITLSQVIMETIIGSEKSPSAKAIGFIKDEVQQLF